MAVSGESVCCGFVKKPVSVEGVLNNNAVCVCVFVGVRRKKGLFGKKKKRGTFEKRLR